MGGHYFTSRISNSGSISILKNTPPPYSTPTALTINLFLYGGRASYSQYNKFHRLYFYNKGHSPLPAQLGGHYRQYLGTVVVLWTPTIALFFDYRSAPAQATPTLAAPLTRPPILGARARSWSKARGAVLGDGRMVGTWVVAGVGMGGDAGWQWELVRCRY